MAIVIERDKGLQRRSEEQFGLECPYCGIYSHMTPQSVPEFDQLHEDQPKHVGLVYQCDACLAPVFLRFAVKQYFEKNRREAGGGPKSNSGWSVRIATSIRI